MKRQYQKIGALFLILTLVFSSIGFVNAQTTDYQSHWASPKIAEWIEKGYIEGYDSNTFKPDSSITRAEFAALVNRSFGFQNKEEISYKDVPVDAWYSIEIQKAKAAGYLTGYEDNSIQPQNNITRQEAAVILSRIVAMNPYEGYTNISEFKDTDVIASWSRAAVSAGLGKTIISGYPDKSFRPLNSISRAETVVLLDRALAVYKNITVYNEPKTYGPSTGTVTMPGDVVVAASGASIQNAVIAGDLTIAQSVGSGDVTLANVQVKGKVYINGGGANSIHINNCRLSTVIVGKDGVRIITEGNTAIQEIRLVQGAVLEETNPSESGFINVIISEFAPANIQVSLKGNFGRVTLAADKAAVSVLSGSIKIMEIAKEAVGNRVQLSAGVTVDQLNINTQVTVTGKGQITAVINNVSGSTFETPPASQQAGTSTTTAESGQTVTISQIELNNTFGSFRFETDKVTTADALLGKIRANGAALASIEKRNQGTEGMAWKAYLANPQHDTDYTITCSSPFVISGAKVIRWSEIAASAVTNVEANDVGDSNNGSDLRVSFDMADGENQKVDEYRIMVVKASEAGSFNLAAANNVSAANYTSVSKKGSDINEVLSSSAKSTDGTAIRNDISYKVFVLTIADGVNATVNALSSPVSVALSTASGGGGGDSTPPVFSFGYPKILNIGLTSCDLYVKMNEAGTAYYVILTDGAAAPTSAQVKAGKDSTEALVSIKGSNLMQADTENVIGVTGLSAGTAYDAYVVIQDSSNNLKAAPVKVDVTTNALGDQSTASAALAAAGSKEAGTAFDLSITGAKNSGGTALSGSIGLSVTKDDLDTVYSGSTNFTDGNATVTIPTGAVTSAGIHNLTVSITGVQTQPKVAVTVTANSQYSLTNSSVEISPNLAENTRSTITVTLRDDYSNPLINKKKNLYIIVDVTDTGATEESYTVGATTVTALTEATVSPISKTNIILDSQGRYQFDVIMPSTIDLGDGISVGVWKNDLSAIIGSAFTYTKTDESGASASLSVSGNKTSGVPFEISITNAKDVDGADLSGSIGVTVTSDGADTVYSGSPTFTAGAATLKIPAETITTTGTHLLTVAIAGVTTQPALSVEVVAPITVSSKSVVTGGDVSLTLSSNVAGWALVKNNTTLSGFDDSNFSNFSVEVNEQAVNVTNVYYTSNANKIKLVLQTKITSMQTVTVSYTMDSDESKQVISSVNGAVLKTFTPSSVPNPL